MRIRDTAVHILSRAFEVLNTVFQKGVLAAALCNQTCQDATMMLKRQGVKYVRQRARLQRKTAYVCTQDGSLQAASWDFQPAGCYSHHPPGQHSSLRSAPSQIRSQPAATACELGCLNPAKHTRGLSNMHTSRAGVEARHSMARN